MPAQPLQTAVRFLLDRQAPDGAWRSDTYGVFKDGDALTPLAMNTLLDIGDEAALPAVRRGAGYLVAMVSTGGAIDAGPHGLAYPVYTAALSITALRRLYTVEVTVLRRPGAPELRRAAFAWLTFLLERQLNEDLGWLPSDVEYGGWGYAHGLPTKPPAGQTIDPAALPNLSATAFAQTIDPAALPNLSATAFALDALRAAGVSDDDLTYHKAICFVLNCQNFADTAEVAEPRFDDGGFFFVLGDAPRNKAGVAGTDRRGRERYVSYGSTTADGLRALLACGLSSEDVRVTEARWWLVENFTAAEHPGRFGPERRAVQAAVYFYYCWSAARALAAADVRGDWPTRLTAELTRRQRPDGSWVNDAVEVREDDPIVATCLAAGALAVARSVIR